MTQEDIASVRDGKTFHLAVSWFILVPPLYFAPSGLFWFQRGAQNNELSGKYGTLATPSLTNVRLATTGIIFLFVAVVIAPRIVQLVRAQLKNRVFLLLTLLAIFSCLWSQFPGRSFGYSLCLSVDTLFAFYLYKRFNTAQQLRLFLAFGWISLISCIITAALFPRYGLSYLGGFGSWQGIYVHKNICAMMTIFLLSAAFYVRTNTLLQRLSRLLYVGLSLFLVVLTQSRTGWVLAASLVAFVIALNVVHGMERSSRSFVLVFGVTLTAVILMTAVAYSTEITYFLGKDPSLTGRTDIWKSILTAVMKRPLLGYGYMGFWVGYHGESANVSLTNGWAVSSSHNSFLAIWLTLGLAGCCLVAYSLMRAIKDALFCIQFKPSPYSKWCMCIVFLVVVVALDEEQLMLPDSLVWILYMVACIGLAGEATRQRLELRNE
jgi:exopolysaccharide production protein ExoQ